MSVLRSFKSIVIAAVVITSLGTPLASYAYDLNAFGPGASNSQDSGQEDFDREAQELTRIIEKVNAELTKATLELAALATEFLNLETNEFDIPTERSLEFALAEARVDGLTYELSSLESLLRLRLREHQEFPDIKSDLPRTRENPSGWNSNNPKKAEPE